MVVLKKELLYTRPSHFQIQFAADLQHCISSAFRVEPGTIHSPKKTVFGI